MIFRIYSKIFKIPPFFRRKLCITCSASWGELTNQGHKSTISLENNVLATKRKEPHASTQRIPVQRMTGVLECLAFQEFVDP